VAAIHCHYQAQGWLITILIAGRDDKHILTLQKLMSMFTGQAPERDSLDSLWSDTPGSLGGQYEGLQALQEFLERSQLREAVEVGL
jgi:hypothetical protein